jgi:hypothetical protein
MPGLKRIAALIAITSLFAQYQPAAANPAFDLSPLERYSLERSVLERLLDNHKVINIVDDFLAFWDVAKDKSPRRQRYLWRRMVENRHRDYFERAIYGEATIEERRALLDEFLLRVPPQVEAMREFNRKAYLLISEALVNFKHYRFRDYFQQREIYIGLSMFRFDGAVRPVGNDEGIPDTLCLGAEVISGYTPDEARVAIAHEFFHLYHFDFLFDDPELADFHTPHLPLMIEGMAVAATEESFPFQPRSLYLHFDESELEAQQADLALNAARYLNLIHSGATIEACRSWFTSSPVEEGGPPRGGYLLGYEVTRRLGAYYTLEQMVRMTPEELREHVEEQLAAIAGSGVLLFASSH